MDNKYRVLLDWSTKHRIGIRRYLVLPIPTCPAKASAKADAESYKKHRIGIRRYLNFKTRPAGHPKINRAILSELFFAGAKNKILDSSF